MKRHSHRLAAAIPLLVVTLLSSCATEGSAASMAMRTERSSVDHLIVRYELGAPPSADGDAPWGSQCVSRTYADTLQRGRWIGAGMRVIRLAPPVKPWIARVIAVQMAQCPYIEWVEPDDTALSIPLDAAISG